MDEREFVRKRREGWDRLAALLAKATGGRGIRRLNREEILAIGPLYRRVSSDLAYARAHSVSGDLVPHLNRLVGGTHALLYEADRSQSATNSVWNFYIYEFPALLQKHARYFLAAVGCTFLGIAVAYWIVAHYPSHINLFIPDELRSSVEFWKSGHVTEQASAAQSGFLMTHNYQAGMLSFALGVPGCAPAAYFLYKQGAMLGAISALMTQAHRHSTFWPGILPHGFAEFTAIFICGAAGFLVGATLLMPGPYRRAEALRLAGIDAIKLVLGSIPLIIFAGIIEGMFSHIDLPATVRLSFAGINGVLWYVYLFMPRRHALESSAAVDERNSAKP